MVRFGDDLPPQRWRCISCEAVVLVFIPEDACANCGGVTFECIRSQEPGGTDAQTLERYHGG